MNDFLHYRILQDLGGNMARVYRALDLRTNQIVVLRLIPDIDQKRDDIAAEEEGAQQQQQLSAHDRHVPQVYEYGRHAGYFYIVMEYIEGHDLEKRLQAGGSLGPTEAARYAAEICEMIVAEQRLGIVHGDLKPANIRLTPQNEVRVLDFGIAKKLSPDGRSIKNDFRSTQYSSPERLDRKTVSVASDLWSVGVLLYEMVSGRKLFNAGSESELERMIGDHRRYNQVVSVPSHCPAPLQAVIRKALAAQQANRYSAPTEFRDDLHRFLNNEPTLAERKPAAAVRDSNPTRRTSEPLARPSQPPPSVVRDSNPTRRTSEPWPPPNAATTQVLTQEPPARPTEPPPNPATGTPVTPPRAKKPAAKVRTVVAAARTGWSNKNVASLVISLVLLYLFYNELGVWRGMRGLTMKLDSVASAQELDLDYRTYQEIARISWGPGLWLTRGSLRTKLLARANNDIERFRAADTRTPLVRKSNWEQAKRALQWAQELNNDSEVAARLLYCDGHILRIEEKPHQAIPKLEEAARLDPKWPDPYLGLARVYAYHVKPPDEKRTLETINKARSLGLDIPALKAMEAYVTDLETRRLVNQAKKISDAESVTSRLQETQERCKRTQQLYGELGNFSDALTRLESINQICKGVEDRLNAAQSTTQ